MATNYSSSKTPDTGIPDNSRLLDVKYLVSLAAAAMGPKVLTEEYEPVMLVPDGMKLQTLPREDARPLSDHIQEEIEITDLESYIAYVSKFKKRSTAIFAIANDAGARFMAVMDYHHESINSGEPHIVGRTSHTVDYAPAYSPEFAAWAAINGKQLTQEQFLDHLRKWGDTISNLSDADLIEMASSLDFTTAGEFSSHTERVKGGRKLLINERVEGSAQLKGKSVTVPESLSIKVSVFSGGREYEIGADLLYRPQNGTLKIITELRRQHLTVRQAVKDIVADVKAGTGIEPFLGRLKNKNDGY